MITRRTNLNVRPSDATPQARVAATEPHARIHPARREPTTHEPFARPPSTPGDIIYGAKAIARYIFGEDGSRARRRVFNLWTHYRDREEKAGFFKLKGALCLSVLQWKKFHGLD
jgi:hypothetical protein